MKAIVKTEVTFKGGQNNRFFEIAAEKKLANELQFKPAALKQFVCLYSILSVSLACRGQATRFSDVLSRVFLAPFAVETPTESIEYQFDDAALWDNYRANKRFNVDQKMNPLAKRFIADAIRFGVSKMQEPAPEEEAYLWEAPEYQGRDRLRLLQHIIGITPLAAAFTQSTGLDQAEAAPEPSSIRTPKRAANKKKIKGRTPIFSCAHAAAQSDAAPYPERSQKRARSRKEKRKRTGELVIDRANKPASAAGGGAVSGSGGQVKRLKPEKKSERQKKQATDSRQDRTSAHSPVSFFKENAFPNERYQPGASTVPGKQ